MHDLLEAIRISLASDATPDARRAGAAACRQVLAGLEPTTAPATSPLNAQAIASMVAAVRGVPPEQLLDLAIGKLRLMLPAGAEPVPPVKPIKFRIVSLSAGGKR